MMLSRTLRRLLKFPTVFPSSAYHFCVRMLSLTSFIKSEVASPYLVIANGSPCVVPSPDRLTFFLFLKSLDGLEYEFCMSGRIDGHIFAMFFKARFQFRELSAFSVSIGNIVSESIFSEAYELHIRCHIFDQNIVGNSIRVP